MSIDNYSKVQFRKLSDTEPEIEDFIFNEDEVDHRFDFIEKKIGINE